MKSDTAEGTAAEGTAEGAEFSSVTREDVLHPVLETASGWSFGSIGRP